MTSTSKNTEILRNSNLRLCRIRIWSNYEGLGMNFVRALQPPHFIGLVLSNSPAAAGGLKIRDVIIAINNQDVSEAGYDQTRDAIQAAVKKYGVLELLVMEQRFYEAVKTGNIRIDAAAAKIIDTPQKMPSDYKNFPKNQPRTCVIHSDKSDGTFGFEVVNGITDIGLFVQEVFPDSVATSSLLRKSDRIIEIDDEFVDDDNSDSIVKKLNKAMANGCVKLYVFDTETYEHRITNKIPLSLQGIQKSRSDNRQSKLMESNLIGRNSFNVNNGRLNPLGGSVDDLLQSGTLNKPASRTSTLLQPPSSFQFYSPLPSLPRADIRLCTIKRGDATDPPGVVLNYHKTEQIHSLNIIQGRNNGPSNAELAGIQTGDRLIEINGENIQNFPNEAVIKRIQAVRYPEPLQMLVADPATYDYYRQHNKTITRRLPNTRILPPNIPGSCAPSPSPPPRPMGPKPQFNSDPLKPKNSPSLQPRVLSIQKDLQLSNGVGFDFCTITNNSSLDISYSHRITSIDNNSSIDLSNLHLNDYILSLDNENIEYFNNEQLKDKLRRIETYKIIIFLVVEENFYQQSLQKLRINNNISEQSETNTLKQNQVQYRLQYNPNFKDYGFRVKSEQQLDIISHQIISIEPHSPADLSGISVGDYILRVNNQTVKHMNSDEFKYLIQSFVSNNNASNEILLLEVVNENTYESINNLPATHPLMNSHPANPQLLPHSSPFSVDNKSYPKMRICTIRSWPHYKDLGFEIIQSSSTSNNNKGYQIQQLQLESPAAHTHIRNGDYIIEVNESNVEKMKMQSVRQCTNDLYCQEDKVSLLVIDDNGYQWYKREHIRIDPLSSKANIRRHITPEYSDVSSPNGSSSSHDIKKKIAADIEEMTKTNQRFFDVQNEPKSLLLPIEGYENMPLVSLENAIKSLEHNIPKIKRNAWIAKERSTDPSDGLTSDESAAIQLYTMQWKPDDDSFYRKLNEVLRSENRDQLTPYFLYLKLVLTALWKLKPMKKTIWRGVKADLSDYYQVGKSVVWWGFGSCTESLDVLQSNKFLGKTGVRTLFSIECKTGRSIRSHTYFKKENEILLLPATQFRVEGQIDSGNGLHIIHLVETKPQFPLLQPPYSREIISEGF